MALGQDISLADVAVMPALVRMHDLGLPGWQDLPRIVTWFDNIRAHPAFKPTFYPGSLAERALPAFAGKGAGLTESARRPRAVRSGHYLGVRRRRIVPAAPRYFQIRRP